METNGKTKKGFIEFPERPVLDKLLADLRKSERESGDYIASGKKAFDIISKEILPGLNKLEEIVEIYCLRLRCNGHFKVIEICERKILEILKQTSPEEFDYEKMKEVTWFWCLHAGFPIFNGNTLSEMKKISGLNKFLAASLNN